MQVIKEEHTSEIAVGKKEVKEKETNEGQIATCKERVHEEELGEDKADPDAHAIEMKTIETKASACDQAEDAMAHFTLDKGASYNTPNAMISQRGSDNEIECKGDREPGDEGKGDLHAVSATLGRPDLLDRNLAKDSSSAPVKVDSTVVLATAAVVTTTVAESEYFEEEEDSLRLGTDNARALASQQNAQDSDPGPKAGAAADLSRATSGDASSSDDDTPLAAKVTVCVSSAFQFLIRCHVCVQQPQVSDSLHAEKC